MESATAEPEAVVASVAEALTLEQFDAIFADDSVVYACSEHATYD